MSGKRKIECVCQNCPCDACRLCGMSSRAIVRNHIEMWTWLRVTSVKRDAAGYGPLQTKLKIVRENNNEHEQSISNSVQRIRYFWDKRMKWLPVASVGCAMFYWAKFHFNLSQEKNESALLTSRPRYFRASSIVRRHRIEIAACVNLKTRSIHSDDFPSPQIISRSMAFLGGIERHLSFHWCPFPIFATVRLYSDAPFVWFSTHLATAFLCWFTVSCVGGPSACVHFFHWGSRIRIEISPINYLSEFFSFCISSIEKSIVVSDSEWTSVRVFSKEITALSRLLAKQYNPSHSLLVSPH